MWLTFITGIASEFISDWKQSRENKRKVKTAAAENKARLLQSEQTHNQTWEMAALEGKDTLLQRASFLMLSAPFVVAIFDAQAVHNYFTIALASVPEWYQWAFVAMLGAIWGIAEFKQWKG